MTPMVDFCRASIELLRVVSPREFGEHFCKLRLYWFHDYAKGRISSTRHGARFFEETLSALESGVYEYTGEEYDKNYALILAEHGVKIKKEQKRVAVAGKPVTLEELIAQDKARIHRK